MTQSADLARLVVVRVCVLGPLIVDGVPAAVGPRDRVVLEALALRLATLTSAEQLADALWPSVPPRSWNKVVHGCILRLRRLMGPGAIHTTRQGYRLRVPAEDVDAYRFAQLAARGHELMTLGDPERARSVLVEALALWRGRSYGDLETWDPARIETQRLEALRLDAEELSVDAALLIGRHREVLAEAQSAVFREPTREHRWAQLARAEYLSGRQIDALETLRRARNLLVGEAGLDPGPELSGLEARILKQDPSLAVQDSLRQPSGRCPYPGLIAYEIDDCHDFFGRERVVDECLRILRSEHVLAVVGPPGSGKSSVVRAGVAATLVRQGRPVQIITPTARLPADALTTVHPDPATVLVVDQCEGALGGDEPDGALEFLDLLTAITRKRSVVLAIRADRLEELSEHAGFAAIVQRGLLALGAMEECELRRAIEEPARRAGLLVEAALVDLLVRKAAGEPGALPLVSHALRQTWGSRDGAVLTLAGYQATGGMRSAVVAKVIGSDGARRAMCPHCTR